MGVEGHSVLVSCDIKANSDFLDSMVRKCFSGVILGRIPCRYIGKVLINQVCYSQVKHDNPHIPLYAMEME
jgi:hypothetical protein